MNETNDIVYHIESVDDILDTPNTQGAVIDENQISHSIHVIHITIIQMINA